MARENIKITQAKGKISSLNEVTQQFKEYHESLMLGMNDVQKRISDNIKRLHIGVINNAVNKVISKIIQEEMNQLDTIFKTRLNSIQNYIDSENNQNQINQTLSEEQMKLLDDCAKVKGELKKFASITFKTDDLQFTYEIIQPLLSIYRILIEKIWQGQAHYRILHILHGEKEEIARDELRKSTGIEGAFLLRAIKELTHVNLVEFDENKDIIKLKRRLFSKIKPKE